MITKKLLGVGFLCLALSPLSLAQGSFDSDALAKPASMLVYPAFYSDDLFASVVSITNTNVNPNEPSTRVRFEYYLVDAPTAGPSTPAQVSISFLTHTLTPGDTRTVLPRCQLPETQTKGYIVASAEDPANFDEPWSYNHLIGSQTVYAFIGSIYTLDAVPFLSLLEQGALTDVDADGRKDMNGVEYQGLPGSLLLDGYVAEGGARLALLGLSGDPNYVTSTQFQVYSDTGDAFAIPISFRGWIEIDLLSLSPVFGSTFIRNNLLSDGTQLDVDCDVQEDYEVASLVIVGTSADHTFGHQIPSPGILGAVTGTGAGPIFLGGKSMWALNQGARTGEFPGAPAP